MGKNAHQPQNFLTRKESLNVSCRGKGSFILKTKFGFKKKPLAVSRKGANVLQIRRMNYDPDSASSVNRTQRGISQADNLISRLNCLTDWLELA